MSRDKKPYYSDGNLRNGELDTPNDIAKLVTYNEIRKIIENSGGQFELGFALGPDGKGGVWQGVDLDHVEANDLNELANNLPGYVERSRSGNGGHSIGYGREFKTLGSNGSGIEAYCKGRFFVVTTDIVRDAPLTDIAPFVEGALAPIHQRRRLVGGEATGVVDSATVTDLRTALMFISSDDHGEWVATGHALKTIGAQGFGLFMEWSKRSAKFDHDDAERVWASFNPTDTSYKAIFAKAQDAGWKNPGKVWGVPTNTAVDLSAFGSQRFKLLNSAAVRAIVAMEWALKGVLVLRGVAVFYGPSASGKSFLVFDLLAAIAEGKPFFGLRTTQRFVVYMALEGRSGVRGRMIAWEAINGRPLPDNFAVILDQFDLKSGSDVAELASRLPKGCVIAIDTLARAGDEDENDAKQRALVINGMMELQRLIDGLVIAVAHTGKEEDKGLRGHKKLFDALDAVVAVKRNGERRTWTAEKVKDGQDGLSRHFKLAVVPLGIDDDGDDITSAVIAPEHGTFTPARSKPLSPGTVAAMTVFRDAAGKFGKLNDDGEFLGLHIEAWREEFYRTSTKDSEDAKRQAFGRARKALVEAGELRVDNDHYLIDGPNAIVANGAIAAQIRGVTP